MAALKADALFLFLGVSILPVYVFGSGGVQPAHLMLALFSGWALLSRGIPAKLWSVMLFSVFVHSFVIEGVYSLLGGDPGFMIHSVFFLYNFILTASVYLYVRDNGLSVIVPGIFIAAGIAFLTIMVSGINLRELGDAGRATGTFNNPNQLGYFSVCLLSLAYLFYREGSIGYWRAAGIFLVSIFLAISSLSKAAMAANFIVLVIALKPAASLNALFGWFVAALVGMASVFYFYLAGAFDQFLFMERFANMAYESDSSLASRGYFAFLQGNPVQVLFGLGAQGVDRIVGHEVHSTLGSMVNSYGFVGFLMFSVVLVIWAYRLWKGYGLVGMVCLVAPAMLYGITHNGIRFTIFWILFAASMAMAVRREVVKGSAHADLQAAPPDDKAGIGKAAL